MNKSELIDGLSILLSLDKPASKDLEKLSKETLELMFENYKANALSANNRIEREVNVANKHSSAPSTHHNRSRKGRRLDSLQAR